VIASDEGTLLSEVRVYTYDLTYAHGTYVMSQGREISTLTSVVVAVTATDGTSGYGEVCPLGATYLPGFAGGVIAAIEEVAPAVLGADVTSLSAVREAMELALRGHGYAKSVLEVACWDLLGKVVDVPCHVLLGGLRQERFPLYVAVPLGLPGKMADFTARARASGIHRFQLKIGGSPAEDVARVRAVVEATGDDDVIVADANGGWRLQDATLAVRMLEGMPRVRLEQPCPTIEECMVLRERTTMPFVLDEVITDVASLLRCHQAGVMDAINLKISRVGGLAVARTVRELAEVLGLRLTIEDTWGGDLTTAVVSQLAASTAPEAFYAASFMNDWTLEHVAGYEPSSKDGWGRVGTGPGLGVDVDEHMLGAPLRRYRWQPGASLTGAG
jgi:L-alanine-DL-glutamate epimerase-like enolase superfamily enzyme